MVKSAAHASTKEANSKLREEADKLEEVSKDLRELLEKRKAWYNEQLVKEREATHQVKIRLKNEMGQLIDRHEKETGIWTEMKKHYEDATTTYKQEILNLKTALQEAQNRVQVVTVIRIVLQMNREKFSAQLKTTVDKG